MAETIPATSSSLPNQVFPPSPKSTRNSTNNNNNTNNNNSSNNSNNTNNNNRRYREAYPLTQLGGVNIVSITSLASLLDEENPESGFGLKPGGTQGFMAYCKDLESMSSLPALPADLLINRFSTSLPTKLHSPNNTHNNNNSNSNNNTPIPHSLSPLVRAPSTPPIPISIARSESVPDPGSTSSRQSSPVPNSAERERNKMAFSFRGSTTGDKIANRKSTPEFDRKQSPSSAASGSHGSKQQAMKKQKSKSKKKSDNERMARKEEKRRRAHGPPIVVRAIEDFPEEAVKLIKKTKIPDQQLLDNLKVIVHIIRFRTGFNVRTEEEMNKSKEEKAAAAAAAAATEGSSTPKETKEPKEPKDDEFFIANITRPSTESADVELQFTGKHSGLVSLNNPETPTVSRQRDNNDFDSDALDPSIVPKGSEDLLTDPGDIKKMYKNLQQAGRGGFGSVFVAKSTQDKCDIAIKKLPHITKKMKRTNFNEIGFLNSCKHLNIVKYYRSHLIDDEIWVVMEYMQGGTLAEAVERYSFAESSVAYVAREMLKALEYLHELNLVHRDLKSANVMLTVEGKIKLIDFGLCVDHTQRKLCHMAGSPFWMPPEMILGVPHGPAADIWSFAICLLELANGEPPNRKSPVKAMFLAATEGIVLPADKHSPEFTDFLGKCLQIDQTKRALPGDLLKHPFLNKADSQDTMRKILAQIFISNAISNLDYGL